MSLTTIVQRLPPELQFPMLDFAEAIEQEMRAQLAVRREDITQLQVAIQDLTAAQKRSEQRIDRLEIALIELAEAQKRTEQRVEELAEAQKRTEQRVEELAEAQKRTEQILQKVVIRVDQHTGQLMELTYRDRAYAYFGTLLRGVKVISLQDIESTLEQHLSEAEFQDLLPLDLLVQGRLRHAETPSEIYLAVEVSAVVDVNDVKRAYRRAMLLRKAGYTAVAVVAGQDATAGAQKAAQESPTLLLQNGSKYNWEKAVAEAQKR